MEYFLQNNFILESSVAEKLYFDYAAPQPIIDYHSHLSPHILARNQPFENMTELWLQDDHYKWRAMRAFGVEELFITGEVDPREKFRKWAEVVPYTIRSPLFHWTHMELKNPFGIKELLNPNTADRIYNQTLEQLQSEDFKPRKILQNFNVEMQGTTDDPIDSLMDHQQLRQEESGIKVLPSFRPDQVFNINQGDRYRNYMQQLEQVSYTKISNFESLIAALKKRIDYFHLAGCVSSDHSFPSMPVPHFTIEEADQIFQQVMNGDDSQAEKVHTSFTFYVLTELCKLYYDKGWVQQFHLGALRDGNINKAKIAGSNQGYDSIGDYAQATQLSFFLSHMEGEAKLAKTIIYNLNPSDNALFAAMIGNFQGDGIKGKIQLGSAWWFLDHLDGMTQHLNELSNIGLLSTFIGMTTDSRSFVSYSRHDYFRRLLCNLLANDIRKGYLPHDIPFIGSVIKDICYQNIKNYFNL